MYSGVASAVREPGHLEVRKSSSQVTRMDFFLFLTTFLVVALKTKHYYTEAKQHAGLGRAEPELEPGLFEAINPVPAERYLAVVMKQYFAVLTKQRFLWEGEGGY